MIKIPDLMDNSIISIGPIMATIVRTELNERKIPSSSKSEASCAPRTPRNRILKTRMKCEEDPEKINTRINYLCRNGHRIHIKKKEIVA